MAGNGGDSGVRRKRVHPQSNQSLMLFSNENCLSNSSSSTAGTAFPVALSRRTSDTTATRSSIQPSTTIDFDAAVRTAQAEYDRHRPAMIVGSSRGGAVAMNIDSGDTPLVLLCPAWRRREGRYSGLPPSALIEVGTDHRLADPEPLAAMLRARVDACVPD